MSITSNIQFTEKARTWLNNKIILSQKSHWYNLRERNVAIYQVKSVFSSFLSFPTSYNTAQLALHIKRNEDLLLLILPNPHNPSYNNALSTLSDLIEYAGKIITENNLQELLAK
jgi:hypothetical protein